MPCCCLGVLSAFMPRIALIVMWLTGYAGRAFDTALWPILGFFFLPFTACAYAIALNDLDGLRGWGLALFIFGVFLDIGSHGGTSHGIHQRRSHRVP